MTIARNVNENPCNMCMPMGGIIPFKGIENAMVIIHGSQGCSTYMRRHIAEHFNEPVDVGSSSLNEKGTVYGGEKNLKQALDNIIRVYQPKLIGVLTTCLSETIGEDIERITAEYQLTKDREELAIVAVPTPGYGGSHTEGYLLALKKIVMKLAKKTARKHNKVNVIVPHISSADVREIKRILQMMDIQYTLFPDVSDTLDRPLAKPYTKIPAGGTPLAEIEAMPGAIATIQLGVTMDDELSPGKYLEEEFGVPLYNVPIPIGLENTDRFMTALGQITNRSYLPPSIEAERGRLLDAMVDSHKYNFQGRSVIFGEPELVYAVSKICFENGVFPVVIGTGSPNNTFAKLIEKDRVEVDAPPVLVLSATDFVTLRREAKNAGANIAIGHSDGRYIEEQEKIPLVRLGFPIHDRVGGQRLLSVGYTGTAMFLDRITNTLLAEKRRSYRKSMYEKFYQGLEHPPACDMN